MKITIANGKVAKEISQELRGTFKPVIKGNSKAGYIVGIPYSPNEFWNSVFPDMDEDKQTAILRRIDTPEIEGTTPEAIAWGDVE